MNCEEVQQLLPQYATGSLDVDQTAEVRAHLESRCPACGAALAEIQWAIELFPGSLKPMQPSPAVKQKLMAMVEHGNQPPAVPARMMQALCFAMAACILLLAGGIYFLLMANRDLTASLAERNSRIAQLDKMDRFAGAADLNLVELAGQKSNAHGHILYDPADHYWRVYIFDLQPPPINHVYELWAITPDNKKLPAGTFTVDAHGNAVYTGTVPGTVAAAAVTDEPAPGTNSPTGTIQLLGKINGGT